MNRRTLLTAIGASMIAVSGCVEEKTVENVLMQLENTEHSTVDFGGNFGSVDMFRFVDRNAGVVLYYKGRTSRGSGSGLTAIPIEETNLE